MAYKGEEDESDVVEDPSEDDDDRHIKPEYFSEPQSLEHSLDENTPCNEKK